jgi:hypothetical protein
MAATTLAITDANQASKTLSVNADASNSVTTALIGKTSVSDPTTGLEQNVRADGRAYVSAEGGRMTYRYAIPAFTPVATPTEMVVIQGSATKIVTVKKITVGGAATAAGSLSLVLTRRSGAGTLGSAVLTPITPAKHKGSTAATAVVSSVGTANYTTPGTVVAYVGAGRATLVAIGSAATSGEGKKAVWEFGVNGEAPFELASDSEWLTLDGAGGGVPSGGVLDIEVVTTEHTA